MVCAEKASNRFNGLACITETVKTVFYPHWSTNTLLKQGVNETAEPAQLSFSRFRLEPIAAQPIGNEADRLFIQDFFFGKARHAVVAFTVEF